MKNYSVSNLKNFGGGVIDLELTGFTQDEIDELLVENEDEQPIENEDEIPEPPKIVVTKRNDIWLLGENRLMCGSSTNAEDVSTLLGGAKPQILLTDPPYCSGGFQETGRSAGSIGTDRKDENSKRPEILNDKLSTRGFISLLNNVFNLSPALFAYVFTDWRMWCYLYDCLEYNGLNIRSMIVWDKGTPGMGKGWRSQHELAAFAVKTVPNFDGHKGYGNVLKCKRSGNELHPTQKPVELIEQLIDNTINFAHGIFDPFAGSGTTLIAAQRFNEKCFLMELDPKFCDVIVKRWQNLTGQKAYRESDGVAFDDLAN